jgi:tetratricopeptide (TPR) repeat protein
VEADCLKVLGRISYWKADVAARRAYHEESMRIYQEIGDLRQESIVRYLLAITALDQGDYDEGRVHHTRVVAGLREVGDRWEEVFTLAFPGLVHHALGNYDAARPHYEQYLRGCRETGDERGVALALRLLSLLSHHVGDNKAAQEFAEQALQMFRDQEVVRWQGSALTLLGHALVGLARLDEARGAYRQAVDLLGELARSWDILEALAGLARVCLAQGDLEQAQTHVEEILRYLETGTLDGVDEPIRVYLTCYRVLHANGDPRADDILEEGYRFLQERAAKISDEKERRSYLENVAANNEIVEEWAERSKTNDAGAEPLRH